MADVIEEQGLGENSTIALVRTLHTMFLVLHVLTVPSATLELLRFGPPLVLMQPHVAAAAVQR